MNPLASIIGALKYMPASVARKALEKANPGFKNYFAKSLSYGIDANRALDYITERFESESQRSHKQQLEQGAAKQTLRPDEMLSRSQLANQERPAKLLKSAAAIGAGASLGSNQEPKIEEEISNQISPLSKSALQEQAQPGSNAEDAGIQRLFGFIEKQIEEGNPLEKAVSQARSSSFFKPVISGLEKKTGMPILDFFKSKFSQRPTQNTQQTQMQGAGKQEFLAGLNQLSQTLQGLRNR